MGGNIRQQGGLLFYSIGGGVTQKDMPEEMTGGGALTCPLCVRMEQQPQYTGSLGNSNGYQATIIQARWVA